MRLIGKQGHRAAAYNQTELGAHAISVLSCTGSHITVVMYFYNNSLLATELKLHVLRQIVMENENKNVTFTNNVFYRNEFSDQRLFF